MSEVESTKVNKTTQQEKRQAQKEEKAKEQEERQAREKRDKEKVIEHALNFSEKNRNGLFILQNMDRNPYGRWLQGTDLSIQDILSNMDEFADCITQLKSATGDLDLIGLDDSKQKQVDELLKAAKHIRKEVDRIVEESHKLGVGSNRWKRSFEFNKEEFENFVHTGPTKDEVMKKFRISERIAKTWLANLGISGFQKLEEIRAEKLKAKDDSATPKAQPTQSPQAQKADATQ